MKYFENLSQAELLQLEEAIPQIAVLIAGADGRIDVKETEWAEKLTHIRTYSSPQDLHEFYEQIDANFSTNFNALINDLPKDTATRQEILNNKLSGLNAILAKLEPHVAYHLYDSFVSFAKNIARASGGVLGFGAVSNDEAHWMNLPMLNAIEMPKDLIGKEEEADN
jgi:hypothetical protein